VRREPGIGTEVPKLPLYEIPLFKLVCDEATQEEPKG
jgi:hypothetical protein